MKDRPKFHPCADDYFIATLKNGGDLEYATTEQFGELLDWADEAEKEIERLKRVIIHLKKGY